MSASVRVFYFLRYPVDVGERKGFPSLDALARRSPDGADFDFEITSLSTARRRRRWTDAAQKKFLEERLAEKMGLSHPEGGHPARYFLLEDVRNQLCHKTTTSITRTTVALTSFYK